MSAVELEILSVNGQVMAVHGRAPDGTPIVPTASLSDARGATRTALLEAWLEGFEVATRYASPCGGAA